VAFDLKTGFGVTKVNAWEKFKLVLKLNPNNEEQAATIDKLREVDVATVEHVFKNRASILPPEKVKFITDANSMQALYNPLVKEGKELGDGRRYDPSFTLQVPQIASLVDSLKIESKENKDGSKEDQVTAVNWKEVPSTEPRNDKAPKFYMCIGKTDDGKDVISSTVPRKRADGSVMTNAAGEVLKRWVGPQDIVAGATARCIVKFSKVYMIAAFGMHMDLVAVVVEPPAGKPSTEIDGVVEMDNYDPIVAARVLSQNVAVKSESSPPSDDEPVADAVPAPALEEAKDAPAPDALASPTKKRKSEKSEERKAKRVAAE
jgi:hypothetical protein